MLAALCFPCYNHPMKAKNKLILWCRTLSQKLLASLRRFPVTVLICAITAAELIIFNHTQAYLDAAPRDFLIRLALVSALGIPLSLCIKVLCERTPFRRAIRVLIYLAALAGLILYYLFLLQDFGVVAISRYMAVSLALYFAFAYIPYFYRRENFELYVIRLLLSFLVTYLYASILYGGVAAILLSTDYLFPVDIPEELYFDLWFIVAGVLAPAFFLADIPGGEHDPLPKGYPKVLQVLLSYIVMPLILAYSLMLYAYFALILITAQWPELMVSHLVLWYAILATLVIFCLYPLRRANQWIRATTTIVPWLNLPLLAMMFTAMGVRINAYGFTENRYFVLAAGLWITGCMIYLIAAKRSRNIVLPVSLSIIAILAVFGPWSSYSVSVWSQNLRFEKILAEHDLLKDGALIAPTGTIPETGQREISSIILYFERNHGLDELRALPQGSDVDDMEELLGFPLQPYPDYPGREENFFRYSLRREEVVLPIADFDYFAVISPIWPGETAAPAAGEGPITVVYSSEDHELHISVGGAVLYRRDVAEIMTRLHRENSDPELAPEELTFSDQQGKLKVVYLFKWISGVENEASGEIRFDPPEFYLFITVEE